MRRLKTVLPAAPTWLAAVTLAGLMAACEDQSYRHIGIEVNVLTKSTDDSRIAVASERLLELGPRALPQLENALHAAPEKSRLRIVATLSAMAHPEVIPILRHLAVYDPSPEVRNKCESTLKGWSVKSTAPGPEARAALTRVAQLRAAAPGP